jgi:hypothetical protein
MLQAPVDDDDEPFPDVDPADMNPVVIVAPELKGRDDYVVVREPEDTDETYHARCALFRAILSHAKDD